MVKIMARIASRDGTSTQMRQILHALVGPSRNEPGCIGYELFQDQDDPLVFVTIEHWADQSVADAHLATLHVAAAIAQATELLAQPPIIHRFTPVA